MSGVAACARSPTSQHHSVSAAKGPEPCATLVPPPASDGAASGAPHTHLAVDLGYDNSSTPKPEPMDASGDLTPPYNSVDSLRTSSPTRDAFASMEIDLVGVKMVKKPGAGPHNCPMCLLPIRIYGRLTPCRHAFCWTCAQPKTCSLCNEAQTTIEKLPLSDTAPVFVCEFPKCGRSYTSEYSFQEHQKLRAHVPGTKPMEDKLTASIPEKPKNDKSTMAIVEKPASSSEKSTPQTDTRRVVSLAKVNRSDPALDQPLDNRVQTSSAKYARTSSMNGHNKHTHD